MRRDLEQYLAIMQKQLNEMNKAVDEANELIKEGKLSSEQAMQIQNNMVNINNNYQRVLYCRYLLNLPPKFIQKIRRKREEAQMRKFAEQNADKESVEKENEQSLEEIKEVIDGNKEE